MNKMLKSITVFGLLALSSLANAATHTMFCRVSAVVDGDVFQCKTARNEPYIIRLANIDAPDMSQTTYAQYPKAHLEQMILGKAVEVKSLYPFDITKRNLSEVYRGGVNIGKEQIKNGFAFAYREIMTDSSYLKLEEQAKRENLGVWAHNIEYPAYYRNRLAAARQNQQR